MAKPQWARSRGELGEREGLRRGAWYRVMEDQGNSWLVLDVHNVEVRIPRDHVEMRGERPQSWSVVRHPYLVCPGCHTRRYVSGEPPGYRCPDCDNEYPIDWRDSA